ncbi:hypothetical protein [Puniceicoccus vermicola]|uniref:Uncharacterized protein n=1 Tax=Puniceicoccus vermicola TaxID=388746 RepID=A0A7X1AWY8_9BACT|nr:hypothetical protein [Puniceicoccus vermicola]MBC2600345.1 hypothetical protein [Puniceicoccus vermicola]
MTAVNPSDAYLMYGYDEKELTLPHASPSAVTFTIEVDFQADYTWYEHTTLTVQPGETLTYTFPAGFRAHWVRVTSDTNTTASAQFLYGPADKRDTLVDWAR